jgi:TolB-like protein
MLRGMPMSLQFQTRGVVAMTVPAPPSGINADDDAAASERPAANVPEFAPTAPSAASIAASPALAYAEFAAALKDALRDVHSPDLLARNPLLGDRICNFGGAAGPAELKALLSETVSTLFDNARDEKLRRVVELTYFQPGMKQEVVADRLSLSFGTYRCHLSAARERLARWLWERSRIAQRQTGSPAVARTGMNGKYAELETTVSSEAGAREAPRLSIVVMPFLNIGGAAEDDPFIDGITETLTTDLARFSGVFAISRSTAFTYKGRAIDTRQIGRELGVRYVLEGSVQNANGRVRTNVQLVDTDSGAHLWAERFDTQSADLLDMQDEITARLARTIYTELVAAESRRAERVDPDHLEPVDHIIRGWARWNQHQSLEAARQARDFFEAALRLDEDNLDALLGVANAHMWEVNNYASEDREGQIRAAEAAAAKALALMPSSAEAHVTYGTVLFAMCMPERALREFQLATGVDGTLAIAHAYIGLLKVFLGRAGESRGHILEAMRLSPRDPLLFNWHFIIGVADLYLGRVVHALDSLRRSVEINPNWGLSRLVLAAALGLAGLLAEATEVCAVARRLAPNFTIAKFRAEAVSDNPVYLAQREYLCDGLRLAGIPEG